MHVSSTETFHAYTLQVHVEEPLMYTSKFKNLRIKKRDGIKSRETRPGWGEAHNVYKACVGTTEGF